MGKVLGRYEVVGLLGRGGMGDVHLGFDPSLERYVAIKQISETVLQHPENATLLAYFEREAKVVASLQHPNIIQVYEFGNPPGQMAHIVTEFVDGVSLEELLEDTGPIPAQAAVAVLHPMADALEYAHERGIIHRDLKPGNVMLSRHGRVFLMDFGLAKPLGGLAGSGLKSMIIGSPAFMAPEQVGGEATDKRTDVFAFGLLTFALCTGRLFFSQTAAKAFKEILDDHYPVDEQIKEISDPDLRAVIQGSVQRDPEDRFQTMEPVVALFDRAVQRLGIGSPGREIRRWAQRWAEFMPQQFTLGPEGKTPPDTTPKNAAFSAPTILSELPKAPRSAPAVAFSEDMLASDSPSRIIGSRTEASPPPAGDSEFVEGATVIEPSRGPVSEPWVAPAIPVLPPPPARVVEVVDVDTAPLATLRNAVDGFDEPALLRRLLVLVAAHGGQLSFTDVRAALSAPGGGLDRAGGALAHLVESGLLVQAGEDGLAFARPDLQEAVWRAAAVTPEGQTVLRALLDRLLAEARAAEEQFDADGAIDRLDRAGAVAARVAGLQGGMVRDIVVRRAELALGHFDPAALDLFTEALAGAGTDRVAAVRARLGLGHVYLLQNRTAKALENVDVALATAQGTGHWLARCHRLRGLVRLRQGELRAALVDLRLALEHPSARGLEHDQAQAQLALGEAYWWAGRERDASDAFETASRAFDGSGDVASVARADAMRGWVALESGQLDAAEDLLEQARGSAKPVGARDVVAEAWAWLAEVYRVRGDLDSADRAARRGLAEYESVRDARGVVRARTIYAGVLCDAGELGQAGEQAEEAERGTEGDPLARLRVALVRAKVSARRLDFTQAMARIGEALGVAAPRGIALPFAHLVRARLLDEAHDHTAPSARDEAARLYGKRTDLAREALDHREIERWFPPRVDSVA